MKKRAKRKAVVRGPQLALPAVGGSAVKRKRKRRAPVELNERATYRQLFIRCGNARCGRCKVRATHGPYWYAEWAAAPSAPGGVVRKRTRYVGKRLPRAIAEHVARRGADEARAAAQMQLADEDSAARECANCEGWGDMADGRGRCVQCNGTGKLSS